MKCEFCGGNLSLEDQYCPHCGQMNKHSQEHIREMGRFRKRFESTQDKVYGTTHRYTQLTVRIVLICILIVLTILAVLVGTNAYSVLRDIRKSDTNRKFDEYSAVLDAYMEEGKFEEFNYFREVKQIDWYETPYESYAPVISAARDYSNIVEGIADMICKSEEEEWKPEFLGGVVFSFYDGLDMEEWSWYEGADSEKNREALEKMVNQVEGLLMTYCGLSREQAESLRELNEARITVLLEEAMTDEAQGK